MTNSFCVITNYRVNDIQQELDEYTENSAQLEKELEASLVQVEKQNRDLEHQNQRLKNEIEMLRVSLIIHRTLKNIHNSQHGTIIMGLLVQLIVTLPSVTQFAGLIPTQGNISVHEPVCWLLV